jgi:hypothetical protein
LSDDNGTLSVQGDVRPHAAIIVFQPAEGVKSQDFLAKVVEGLVGVFVFGAEDFPNVAKLVEEEIELGVLDATHPEFGFEVFDAEFEDIVL